MLDINSQHDRLASRCRTTPQKQPRPHGTFPQGILHLTCASGFFVWSIMKTKIYALTDTVGSIRYIGKTSHSLQERLSAHIAEAKYAKRDTYKCRWIRQLLSKRLFPKIQIIKEVDGNGDAEEIVWIKFYREIGSRLVNTTDGGSGVVGLSSELDADMDSRGFKRPCTRAVGGQNTPGASMICPECHKAFTAIQHNQRFCCQRHKDAFHNRAKMTGIHLCPRALYYVQDLANHRIPPITNDEMANEMILMMANSGQEQLTNEEAAGLKEVSGQ